MSRIRHATEEFVNNLIRGINQLISTNTEQIKVLSKNTVPFSSELKQQYDLNNFKDNGEIKGYKFINAPNNITSISIVKNFYYSNDWIVQLFAVAQTKEIYIRSFSNATTWSEWSKIATTDKTEILFPYASGYIESGDRESSVLKVNNKIRVNISIENKNSNTTWGVVGTLPAGYRPLKTVNCLCRLYGGGNAFRAGFIEVSPNGEIRINAEAGANTSFTHAWGYIEYYV